MHFIYQGQDKKKMSGETKQAHHASFLTSVPETEIAGSIKAPNKVAHKTQIHSTEPLPKFTLSKTADTGKRILLYVEYNKGKPIKHKVNFDSPRTAEAASQLGISFEDCRKRYSPILHF